ncbi:helix-turn-helix domain-containing protein [Caballeronia sp. LZ028]|uniref:PucR family transcriptional regulator n=1 Tax=Caballeronia sp. LZ028 TaxID=3038563 RepID=UPI0028605EE2|nr:helix-turn-helix domain-containing protein [Caballeronia sp. LZ028]MDR5769846.1 helix-turn-helix domain-containing protein [Caballeronia sp. LZ028]
MTPTQVRTFERGALVAGVVLLSQERSELVTSNESAAAIRALVSWQQESASALQSRTRPFGLTLTGALRLTVLDVGERDIEYALRKVRASVPYGTLLEKFEGSMVAVCAEETFPQVEKVLRYALLKDERLNTLAVFSDELPDVSVLPRSFKSLRDGIDILKALGRSREMVIEDALTMYSLLFEQRKAADISGFIAATVGRLVAHDERRHTDLAGTLLAYLEHAQNAKSAADFLSVHVNTLRQRLDAVDGLLPGWREGGRFLELHVALRLHTLRKGMAA